MSCGNSKLYKDLIGPNIKGSCKGHYIPNPFYRLNGGPSLLGYVHPQVKNSELLTHR